MKLPPRFEIKPSETIFSVVLRWHRYSCHPFNYQSYHILFKTLRTRIHPFLPHNLADLSQFIGSTPNDLIVQNTLYPLFVFFNPTLKELLKQKILFGNNTVTGLVGIPQAKLPLVFSHKVCPKCFSESKANYGFPSLRIEHQIPGVQSCFRHKIKLQGVLAGEGFLDRQFRFQYKPINKEQASEQQHNFAVFASELLSLCRLEELAPCVELYRQELNKRGYITEKDRIRIARLKRTLIAFYKKNFDLLCTDFIEIIRNFEFTGPLLRYKTRFPAHPIKHLLFSYWLFEGQASRFFERLEAPSKNLNRKSNKDELIISLLNDGMSMAQIEKMTGVSRCYIRRRAELNDIAHVSNGARYSEEVRRSVIRKALLGVHRTVIADELKVGVGYVEQIIGNTPFLSKHRSHLRQQAKLIWAVKKIEREIKIHPDWNRTQIRASQQAAYGALYNIDKELLFGILPKAKKATPPQKDWVHVDEKLVEQIQSLANVQCLSKSAISRKITDGRYLLNSLQHLPNARKLLQKFGKV